VHIERLATRLIADGVRVSLVDPYEGTVGRSVGSPPRLELAPSTPPGVRRYLNVVRALEATSPGAVVHFHIAAGHKFYQAAPLLLLATQRARRRIVTIHGGDWAREFHALGPMMRRLAITTLRAFNGIICVNEGQREEIRRLTSARVEVLPAYLPPAGARSAEPPEVVAALRRSVDALVITSGYGDSMYDYETVLRGVELAQGRLRARLGLVCATYAGWDETYWAHILEALGKLAIPNVNTRNLDNDTFLAVLGSGRIYVRATRIDGDAVAIREAGTFGLQVLATDVVARPSGTVVFACGSSAGLADSIVAAMNDPRCGKLRLDAAADNYAKLLDVYGLHCPRQKLDDVVPELAGPASW
jgi:hypothetical protein